MPLGEIATQVVEEGAMAGVVLAEAPLQGPRCQPKPSRERLQAGVPVLHRRGEGATGALWKVVGFRQAL